MRCLFCLNICLFTLVPVCSMGVAADGLSLLRVRLLDICLTKCSSWNSCSLVSNRLCCVSSLCACCCACNSLVCVEAKDAVSKPCSSSHPSAV